MLRELRTRTIVEVINEIAAATPLDVPTDDYLCSSHILLETEADALDVIAQLDAGLDFAEAAVLAARPRSNGVGIRHDGHQ